MRRRLWAGVAVLTLVVLLVAAEIFCRAYLGLGDPPLSVSDPELEYMFVGPRTYHRFGNVIAYNSFHQRSPELAARRTDTSELRVMVLGDSVVNGGAQTDQTELATSRIAARLSTELARPTAVMNVSAGSWGPENLLAYVKRYGFFDSDLVVLVVSNHDYFDAATFEPIVGVSPDYPDHTPMSALEEAVTRYLPRYVPALAKHTSAKLGDPTAQITPEAIEKSVDAFRGIISMAHDQHIPVLVAQHPERLEVADAKEWDGHKALREAAAELDAPTIDLRDAYAAAVRDGRVIYRDDIHPTIEGQAVLADALYAPIVAALAPR